MLRTEGQAWPRPLRTNVLALAALLAVSVGCRDAKAISAQRREELTALANDYAFKHVDGEESNAIRKRVTSLPVHESRELHRILAKITGKNATPLQRQLMEAYGDYAEAHGKSFLELSRQEVRSVTAKVLGIPESELDEDY
jgi:hypothetical protein